MRKVLIVGMLLLLCSSFVSAKNRNKTPHRLKALVEQINLSLDSIAESGVSIDVKGKEYYRFDEGVFTALNDTVFIGAFGVIDRIHFVSKSGNNGYFLCINEKGKYSKKTLEQLLFAIQEVW